MSLISLLKQIPGRRLRAAGGPLLCGAAWPRGAVAGAGSQPAPAPRGTAPGGGEWIAGFSSASRLNLQGAPQKIHVLFFGFLILGGLVDCVLPPALLNPFFGWKGTFLLK